MLAVVALAGVSGCSGGSGAGTQGNSTVAASSVPVIPTVAQAKAAYDQHLDALSVSGCPTDCTADLQKVIALTGDLRKAMNADKAGPAFWSGAYVHMDTMDRGATTAGQALNTFRPLILGPAHDLQRWMKAHPAQ